jgi:hypothetical protein
MPKSRWASISSSPLLISVAELSVTIGPMSHVLWADAAATETSASSARGRPRNGPPDAVSTSRSTSSARPPRRHWASAECSESTGTICPGAAAAVTSAPPATSDSLLASASVAPAASAARVGPRPTAPVMPLSTVSTDVVAVSSVAASGPASTSTPGSSSRSARAASSAATATRRTWCARTCSASSATSPPPAASPATVKRSGWRAISSSACVPIEPVEPSTSTDRLPVIASHHPRRVVVRRYGRGEQLP